MRGDLRHLYLLKSIEAYFALWGLTSLWEVRVQGEGFSGFADMTILTPHGLLVVEAELSSRRIARDITKARLLGAQFLWIVVPDCYVRFDVIHALLRIADKSIPQKCVLTLGQVPQQVRKCFPLLFMPNGLPANWKTNPNAPSTPDTRSAHD